VVVFDMQMGAEVVVGHMNRGGKVRIMDNEE